MNMERKNYIFPNKRNSKLTLILLVVFLLCWSTTALHPLDGGGMGIFSPFILIAMILGFPFIFIYPVPAYFSAIIHLYTLQFIGALIIEVVFLYVLSNIILFIKDKIKR